MLLTKISKKNIVCVIVYFSHAFSCSQTEVMTHIEPPTDGGLPDLSSSLNPLAEPPAVVAEAAAVHTTKHPLKRKLQEREEKLEPRKLSGQTHWPDGPVTDDDLASHQSLDVKGKRGGKQEMATVEEGWRVCKVCGTSFTKKFHFDRQMNTHTGLLTNTVTLALYSVQV